jgi:hypothetical protein
VRPAATEVWLVGLRDVRLRRGRGRPAAARRRLVLNLGRCYHQGRRQPRPPTERPTSPPAPVVRGGDGRNQSPPMLGWPPSSDAATLPQSVWAAAGDGQRRTFSRGRRHRWVVVVACRADLSVAGSLRRRLSPPASTGVPRSVPLGCWTASPPPGTPPAALWPTTGCSASGSAIAGCVAGDRCFASCHGLPIAEATGEPSVHQVVAAAEHTRLPRHPGQS